MEVLDFAVEQLGYGFWISSLLGLVITLLCFLFWSITSNMYPDDFNISSSELCSLVWRFSGMVGEIKV